MTLNIAAAKRETLKRFNRSLFRARKLQRLLVYEAGYMTASGSFRKLSNPDRRDLAEAIFFELAGEFEHFAMHTFVLAARKKFSVHASQARFICGSSDRALQGTMGWASPKQLAGRASSLFGKSHFIARLSKELPPGAYSVLVHAHKMRNRIAHPSIGSQMSDTFNYLTIPTKSRKGLSIGRVLLDYRTPAPVSRRVFDSVLVSYRAYSRLMARRL